MKKLSLIIIVLALMQGTNAQVNSSHAFAVGNTDTVNVNWDAYSDSVEILGCYLYKKVTYLDEFELISTEMIVSDDSAFSFIDTGVFNVDYTPIYSIHVITPGGEEEINQCYGFSMIEFEVISSQLVRMHAQVWNNDTFNEYIKVWLGEYFITDLEYNDGFVWEFLMEEWYNHEDNYVFTIGFYGDYELEVSYLYIYNLILGLDTDEIGAQDELFQNQPNPFSTTTQIQMELNERTPVLLEVINARGQLVQVITNETLNPGSHSYIFNRQGLSSGIYFCKLSTDKGVRVNKMVVE